MRAAGEAEVVELAVVDAAGELAVVAGAFAVAGEVEVVVVAGDFADAGDVEVFGVVWAKL